MTIDRDAKKVTAERVIAAPAEKIFDVLADPSMHSVIDGSGTVKGARGNSGRLSLGSKFGMSMKAGVPYVMKNTVVEFEENRRIAWWHMAHNIWRYELEPVEGGTRVTETFDWSKSRASWMLFNSPEHNDEGIEKTLERLDRFVTTGSPE